MFSFKRNILQAGLLNGMTDIHSHLLPGVDDGMKSEEDSLKALMYMSSIGVERIFLTPHVMSDLRENTPARLRAVFERFAANCPYRIKMRLAAEYMLDADFAAKMQDGLLTMGDRHVLVETSYLSPPPGLTDMLYELTVSGYKPIIAHPERYMYMQEETYYRLRNQGYMFQLNLFSLIGAYGHTPQKKALSLLKQGLYDFTGSDVHHLRSYRNAIGACSLSRRQRKELEQLLHNNTMLWDESAC
ncbi:MAG: hypothetical protein LBD21_00310 [Tannerellaceae bacterium]|jgi:tyrosine-protein phosphatase YwqE|nr:hypothetical protein [Tannerellaceae bacterium]